jgi:hypothetical protein
MLRLICGKFIECYRNFSGILKRLGKVETCIQIVFFKFDRKVQHIKGIAEEVCASNGGYGGVKDMVTLGYLLSNFCVFTMFQFHSLGMQNQVFQCKIILTS